MEKRKCIKDHLGNEFPSVKAMCEHWGVKVRSYYSRLQHGYELKDALEPQCEHCHHCTDHLGNKFKNISEMCEYWGVKPNTFSYRRKIGLSLEDALDPKSYKRGPANKCVDHLGNEFDNFKAMAKHYGVGYMAARNRVQKGWSLEEVLGVKKHPGCKDHLGNKFKNIANMCDYWGISRYTYTKRLNSGWSLKDTLETPCKVSDHLGNEFNSIAEMCEHYGIIRSTYICRIERGWSKERALTTPIMNIGKRAYMKGDSEDE